MESVREMEGDVEIQETREEDREFARQFGLPGI